MLMIAVTGSASGSIASIKPDLQGSPASHYTRGLQNTKDYRQLAGSNFTHQSVLTSYLSNDELEPYMRGYVDRCGHMARMFSLGKSKENRELWALELSNNPGATEAKPNTRYVGNMHGDEPASRQLLLGLAEWLCQYHTTDSRAAEIVNGMHLYLVPTVNPDGFDLRQRHNVEDVDLNRDFPDPLLLGTTGLQPTGIEQPETLALMQWMSETHFVASASLHEGAVVANYPWDGMTDPNNTYSASPDDATFRHLASVYANAHTHMHDSIEFAGGITNGAQWYPISGGMQDWAYVSGQCMELTVEVSQDKWPAADLLPGLFATNLPALLAFPLAAAFSGLRGDVHQLLPTAPENATDNDIPLPAIIMVEGIDHVIHASALGNYYRPLAPGSYNVSAALQGYATVSAEIKVPMDGSGVVYDFALPCTTCNRGSTSWGTMYDEEGVHIRAAVYAFLVVAGGAWVLYALWWWCRAHRHSLYLGRRSKATSV
ncbi:hypothetical protein ABBQ32_008176 [Trebouxia sp. C0010 RCD-2024]